MKNETEEAQIKLENAIPLLGNYLVSQPKYLFGNDNITWYYAIERGQLDIIIESAYRTGCGSSLNTESISIRETQSDDGNLYYLHITLLNNDDVKIFITLIIDLIEYTSRYSSGAESIEAFAERFIMWRNMLRHKHDDVSTMKGLLGELNTIIELLRRIPDKDAVIQAWTGPEYTQQDFMFPDFWIETKAVSSSAMSVRINSLGQLDNPKKGYLFIVSIDECNEDDEGTISIERLNEKICSLLSGYVSALSKYREKMKSFEYNRFLLPVNNHFFRITDENVYEVKDEFPRLFSSYWMNGIKSVKYDIYLSSISDWKAEAGCETWRMN